MKKGSATIGMLATTAVTAVTLVAGVFTWTYAQFSTVNANASETNQRVARVEQKGDDIDVRLTRIEDKIDKIISKQK